MPLNLSAAHSSRITKRPRNKNPLLQRSSSSPFAELKRRKPVKRSQSKPAVQDSEEDFLDDRLHNVGPVKSLTTDADLRDVAQTIQYVNGHMFDGLPESGGFRSTRIAEMLNFRQSLPPFVTVAHVHAILPSPTTTEREVAELTRAGTVRKIVIRGRGTGGSSVGDGLVLWKDIEKLVMQATEIDETLAGQFLNYLRENTRVENISSRSFAKAGIQSLMRAGFLTSASHAQDMANALNGSSAPSANMMTSISSISRAASGSVAAVGGDRAIYNAGGRGGLRRSISQSEQQSESNGEQLVGAWEEFQLSLPGTGPYLRLLTAARSHLTSIVTKSKFREMPLYLLKEKWDGGISTDDPGAKAKKYRGEFAGVLPSRTRKWKQFNGLSFDWVLEECLGGGLIELFETGTVGRAVRIL